MSEAPSGIQSPPTENIRPPVRDRIMAVVNTLEQPSTRLDIAATLGGLR